MELLFLAHRVPCPPDRGDKMRSFHMLRHLAERCRIHLGAFADDDADLSHAEALRPLVASLHVERRPARLPAMLGGLACGLPLSVAAFASGGMQRFIEDTPADAILAFSGQMAQFVPERFAGRFVMDFVDRDSAKFAAYAEREAGLLRFVHAREARLLAAYEGEVAARASLSLFVSAAEAAPFRAAHPRARVAALGNGIDLTFYDPAHPPAPEAVAAAAGHRLIVFTGQMDYPPNIEAVTVFARDALPLVPGARFAIVGRNPSRAVRALAGDRVIVTGAVADVRGWLAAADVVAVPLRLARGVQNKLLEAMAMGCPIVASPAAFEGIDATAGRDLIVADGPQAEAGAIRELLDDSVRARALGAAARACVEANHAWEARLAPLAAMLGIEAARAEAAA